MLVQRPLASGSLTLNRPTSSWHLRYHTLELDPTSSICQRVQQQERNRQVVLAARFSFGHPRHRMLHAGSRSLSGRLGAAPSLQDQLGAGSWCNGTTVRLEKAAIFRAPGGHRAVTAW